MLQRSENPSGPVCDERRVYPMRVQFGVAQMFQRGLPVIRIDSQ